MSDLSIDIDDVGAALGYSNSQAYKLDLHTSIAKERTPDVRLKTGLANGYDIVRGRFRLEVKAWEQNQKIEADLELILLAQDGDNQAFMQIFERNAEAINNVILRHAHDAPLEIIDLAEQAVLELIKNSNPDELAQAGLDEAVFKVVRNLVFEKIPEYRQEFEREQKQREIARLVSSLRPNSYLDKLTGYEKEQERQADEFIEKPKIKLDRQQIAQIVNAGLDHLRARAQGEVNPEILVLHNITNPKTKLKRYGILRDTFRDVFRRHIISSVYMKHDGLEEIDLLDIYEHTGQGHDRLWSRMLNQIINTIQE